MRFRPRVSVPRILPTGRPPPAASATAEMMAAGSITETLFCFTGMNPEG